MCQNLEIILVINPKKISKRGFEEKFLNRKKIKCLFSFFQQYDYYLNFIIMKKYYIISLYYNFNKLFICCASVIKTNTIKSFKSKI